MKNAKRAFALATAAFVSILMLTSASEWEGAGAIAGPGELPDTGLYVATNAFPRNTVVDVMNLENEKTVRVIVAGPLNAPGLLISLSQEASSVLKLTPREVGRFRVSMPVDPVAYSRFAEGLASNTDPDYNPMTAIERAGVKTEIAESGDSYQHDSESDGREAGVDRLDTAPESASPEPADADSEIPTLVEVHPAQTETGDSAATREPLLPDLVELSPAPVSDEESSFSDASEPLPLDSLVGDIPADKNTPPLRVDPVQQSLPVRPELVEVPFSPREGVREPVDADEAIPAPVQEEAAEKEVVIVRVIEAPAAATPPATESEELLSFDVPADEEATRADAGPEYSDVPGIAASPNGIHPDEEPHALTAVRENEFRDEGEPDARGSEGDMASVEDGQPLAGKEADIILAEEPDAPPAVHPELVEVPDSAREEALPEALEPGYAEPLAKEIVEVEPPETETAVEEIGESGPDVTLVVEGERPANGIHPDEEPGTPDLRIVALEKAALSLEQAEARPPASGPAPELPADGEIAAIEQEETVESEEILPRIAIDAPFVENLPEQESPQTLEALPRLDENRLIASIPMPPPAESVEPATAALPRDRELPVLAEDRPLPSSEVPPASLSGKAEIAALAEEPAIESGRDKEEPEAETARIGVEEAPVLVAPVETAPAVADMEALDLPVPVIAKLVPGRYYLQICAVSRLDNLVQELSRHARYPLVVHPDSSGNKTVYRLLVGPVNQGESGALLSRFKRSGYRDAFIKKG